MRLRTRWLPIIFFALAGCGNETEIPKEPSLFTDRDEMAFNREFGSGTFVGQVGYNSLLLENRGEGTLEITDIALSGPSQFKLVLPDGFTPGTPMPLETYKRAFVTVEFRPTDDVEYRGTLTIKSNSANAAEKVITLNGVGVNP
ncbi:hypothetical protein HPC49_22625 [Pyxidicoccus fallax]|uniref:Lipoprotein n=1 Tax=Pyxidicoccus fallax TaxID=394095 RepID=A0A848LRC8_9BACT|nr:hypothetical protein [Pyxidicoccus fallax]NMO20251.1 hypothetical protein [Pyxidicoccus fallax]NPC81009.1 hypothetical protein [Pyxidicoccus fallax]